MSTRITGQNTAYTLGQSGLETMYQLPIIAQRAPTTFDRAALGTLWVNSSASTAYVLASVIANVSTWTSVSTGAGTFATLSVTGAGPDAFTVNSLNTGAAYIDTLHGLNSTPLANGQLLIGAGALNVPVAATLTAGPGILITNGSGTITITATVAVDSWSSKVSNFNAAAGNGYVIGSGHGAVTATLPTDNALGDTIEVILVSATASDILAITSGSGANLHMPGDSTARTTYTWPDCSFSGAANPSVTLVCTTASATTPGWTLTEVTGSPVGS